MRYWTLFLALFALSACDAPSDPLRRLQPGETGRVVRIIDGDSLVLDTGLSVRLVGLEAPTRPGRSEPGAPFGKEAARLLEDLTLGRQVKLYYSGLTRDRYDRALAHVKTIDAGGPKLWVNGHLAAEGAARVRTYPDTALLGDALLAAETKARTAAIGLWSIPAYTIPGAGELRADAKGFHIIDGEISDLHDPGREGELCTVSLRETQLRLIADRTAPDLCTHPRGTRLRVRGYVSDARLYVTHRFNIEILGPH